MPTCDMCGKGQESLLKAKIEGTVLDVCQGCARFGEVIERPVMRGAKDFKYRAPIERPRRKEVLQVITDDYAQKIRNARDRMGLTQEEFAKRLNEKHSIMQKMEAGQFRPSISTARKFEKILKVKLIEEHGEDGEIPLTSGKKKSDDGFTLGDFIKVRKKQ